MSGPNFCQIIHTNCPHSTATIHHLRDLVKCLCHHPQCLYGQVRHVRPQVLPGYTLKLPTVNSHNTPLAWTSLTCQAPSYASLCQQTAHSQQPHYITCGQRSACRSLGSHKVVSMQLKDHWTRSCKWCIVKWFLCCMLTILWEPSHQHADL